MKTTLIALPVIAALSLASLTACKDKVETRSETPVVMPDASTHTAYFIKNDRASIGRVVLNETDNGVSVTLDVEGISPGLHGMHFHVKGDCSDEAFLNSGGHINPSGRQHGLKNPDGPDNADLPNLEVDANGNGRQTVFTDRLSFSGAGGRPALFDEDGSALVIHANEDDQMSQPIGGAGPRIACAVITREG